jgi:hypothetical protein
MADSRGDRYTKDGIEIVSNPEEIALGSGLNISESNGVATITTENAETETVTTASPTLSVTGSSVIDSSLNAVDATLPSGEYIGQIKTIVMTDASNSSTVSITNHQTSDPEVATFNATDETGVFMWTGTEWVTIFATCTFV